MDLATGAVVNGGQRLWPEPEPMVSAGPAPDDLPGVRRAPAVCDGGVTFESPGIVPVSARVFYDKAVSRALPDYPEIAQAGWVDGRVVVELLVDATGAVRCARSVSGPAIFRAAAVEAGHRWTFSPRVGPESNFVAGLVEFRFRIPWK